MLDYAPSFDRGWTARAAVLWREHPMTRRLARSARFALLIASTLAASPDGPYAPDVAEPGSVEAIAKFTTEKRFGNPWVADVPDSATVPSPSDFLGHIAGAPGELTRTEKIYAYYRALAATSDRVSVQTIGKTEEGRDILLVAVGDAAALRQMESGRQDMARLADPRGTDERRWRRSWPARGPSTCCTAGCTRPRRAAPRC